MEELQLIKISAKDSPSPSPENRRLAEDSILQKLEEYSEAHWSDFVQLNNKIDRIMSQYRLEGGCLREEMAMLTETVAGINRTNTPCLLNDLTGATREVNSREDTSSKLKKRLHNAIAKSDWPKFSGEGKYNHLRFVQWIDTAKKDSQVDDEIIVFKLITMFTGTALAWYETMRLSSDNQT